MTNKKIVIITLSFTLIHFVLTAFIGHYISVQIGTEMGKIVSDGLIEARLNPGGSDDEAARIYQNMGNKREEINKSWRTLQILISLPARPFITPILKDIRKQQVDKVIAKEKTFEEFRTQGLMIAYAVNLLNSLSLGLLIYVGLRFLYRKQIVK